MAVDETAASTRDDDAPAPWDRSVCAGRVVWLIPERGVRECVLRGAHGGDHRDALGYRWNDARWLD